MTDETKGLTPGVPAETVNQPRTAGAPDAPVVNNAPPAEKEVVKTDAEKAADIAAAEQAAKDAEAQKVADEKAKETPTEDDNAVLEEYVDYGDVNANSAVALLKESGVTAKEADAFFRKAIEADDLSLIDITALKAKVGADKANLILLGVQTYYNTLTSSTKETVAAVHSEVGGDQNWNKILSWAKAKASTDTAFAKQAQDFNKMFDLNKSAATMAARELRALYEKDAGNSSLGVKQVQGDSAATTASTHFEKLSRADYLSQYQEAHRKGDKATMDRLNAQRTATR